jgi:hypothetical protein
MARRIILIETEETPGHSELLTIGTMLRMIEDRIKYGKIPNDEMPSYMELERGGVRLGRFRIIRDE